MREQVGVAVERQVVLRGAPHAPEEMRVNRCEMIEEEVAPLQQRVGGADDVVEPVAAEMVKRFLEDASLPVEAGEELRVLVTGSALASFTSHEASGTWVCCSQPLCVCGLGWMRWATRPDGSRLGGIFDRSATGFLLTGCMGAEPAPALEGSEAASAPGGP